MWSKCISYKQKRKNEGCVHMNLYASAWPNSACCPRTAVISMSSWQQVTSSADTAWSTGQQFPHVHQSPFSSHSCNSCYFPVQYSSPDRVLSGIVIPRSIWFSTWFCSSHCKISSQAVCVQDDNFVSNEFPLLYMRLINNTDNYTMNHYCSWCLHYLDKMSWTLIQSRLI